MTDHVDSPSGASKTVAMARERLARRLDGIQLPSGDRARAARSRLDSLAKPPGSLGHLESLAVRLAAVSGLPPPALRRRTVVVLAADHGVTEQGVSAYPSEVTGSIIRAVADGTAAVAVLARSVGAEVVAVDVGVRQPVAHASVLDRRIRAGTADLSTGPAMSWEETFQALAVGLDLGTEIGQRVDIVGLGEVGIGNTTVAAALTMALTGASAQEAVGRGTGIDEAAMARKREVVERAVARLASHHDDLRALREVGGLEIAGLAGVILGAVSVGRPVVLDGYAATSAALVAHGLRSEVAGWMFAGHQSTEPGHAIALASLGLRPVLELDMRLGEGTGAVLAFPVIEAAGAILREMSTLASVLTDAP